MTPLLLAPLSWVYGSVVRARNSRFDRTPPLRLRWPVVSIGNLSMGGAGKTPLVICLARLLQREGYRPDVLSRGYGRSQQTVERVDPSGSADQFGDEPVLIARSTGAPVYVGASRYQAGVLAESESGDRGGQGVHLLDDGFQHRELARDLDIVVMHRSDLQQRLLPAGSLREPLMSLRRAGVVVLRQEDAELESTLRVHTRPECRFWRVRRMLALPGPLHRAVAFCAVARPAEFFAGLKAAGAGVAEQIRFRDHHPYTMADIDRLAEIGRRAGCDAFVTTDKDAVKLEAVMHLRLNTIAPLRIAALTVEIADEKAALDDMRKSLIVTAR